MQKLMQEVLWTTVYLNFLAGHFHVVDHASILPALTVSSSCNLHAPTLSVLSVYEDIFSDFLSDEKFHVSSKYAYPFYEMESIKSLKSTDYYMPSRLTFNKKRCIFHTVYSRIHNTYCFPKQNSPTGHCDKGTACCFSGTNCVFLLAYPKSCFTERVNADKSWVVNKVVFAWYIRVIKAMFRILWTVQAHFML